MPETTTARQRFADALDEARELLTQLPEDRAAGMATAIDLGTSAAFLFSVSDDAVERATEVVRLAMAHATREGD